MINEKMNNEERAILDKLQFYYDEKVKVHIILKRKNSFGKNFWLNGMLINKNSDRLWTLQETMMGEIRVSISEIENVVEYTKGGGEK
jgi:hypothetical protein